MDFREATDRVSGCITLAEIARAAGCSEGLVRQARLDPSSVSYRKPPANWREILIRLARARGGELEGLADELEAEG